MKRLSSSFFKVSELKSSLTYSPHILMSNAVQGKKEKCKCKTSGIHQINHQNILPLTSDTEDGSKFKVQGTFQT